METEFRAISVPDSGRAQHLHVVAGACSIQGRRRSANEDKQYVSPELDLFIVADGMGGHAAGEVASQFAVDVLSHELAKIAVDATEAEIEFRVHSALDRANCLIHGSAAAHPEFEGLGTTVVLGLLVNHRLYVAGVGDSRAYLVRGGAIECLTVDDTWPGLLFHLGQISADQARRHNMRNVLMSALGVADYDSNQEEIRAIDVYDGDRFLLASDGLTDVVGDDVLLNVINHEHDPQECAKRLSEAALCNDAGDDITCVLFYVRNQLKDEAPAQTRPTIWHRLTSFFRST